MRIFYQFNLRFTIENIYILQALNFFMRENEDFDLQTHFIKLLM